MRYLAVFSTILSFFTIFNAYAVSGVTYQNCYELMDQATWHLSQNWREYGSRQDTKTALCEWFFGVSNDAGKYCQDLFEVALYLTEQGENIVDYMDEYCGPEYCGPGQFIDLNRDGKMFYFYGTYSDTHYVPGCVDCYENTYWYHNENLGSSCLDCPYGYYSGRGAASCTKCPSGTYYDMENAYEGNPCLKCPEYGDVTVSSDPTSTTYKLKEQCYISKTTEFKNNIGTYRYTDDCRYTE